MEDILISSLMTKKVMSTTPDTPLIDVIRDMDNHGHSCMIITEDRLPVGIITERDLVRVLANVPAQQQLFRHKARDIMSSPPVVITENGTLHEALVITRAEKRRHLPVVNDSGQLTGLVTFSNLTEAHFAVFERQREIIDRSIDERTLELVQANEELKAMSFEDGLMKIGNRRSMEIDLHHTTASAIRYKQDYSVILADVDHFKLYNDSYGHLAGDNALKAVASSLKSSIRASDRVYRYGGEEILILLPNTTTEGAKLLAQRMIDGIFALQIPHQGSPFRFLTISAGIGCCQNNEGHENWNEIVEHADAALYQAKKNGRNQVVSGC